MKLVLFKNLIFDPKIRNNNSYEFRSGLYYNCVRFKKKIARRLKKLQLFPQYTLTQRWSNFKVVTFEILEYYPHRLISSIVARGNVKRWMFIIILMSSHH